MISAICKATISLKQRQKKGLENETFPHGCNSFWKIAVMSFFVQRLQRLSYYFVLL